MNELRDHLRRTDPLAHEPPLSSHEAAALRQRVLSFPPPQPHRRLPGRRLTVVTAVVMLCIVASGLARVAMNRHEMGRSAVLPATAAPSGVDQSVNRVYFETPSGMRVVWVFEPSGEGALP